MLRNSATASVVRKADEPAFVYDRRREGLARIESAQRGIEHVVQVDDLNVTFHRIRDGRPRTALCETTEHAVACEHARHMAVPRHGEVVLASVLQDGRFRRSAAT